MYDWIYAAFSVHILGKYYMLTRGVIAETQSDIEQHRCIQRMNATPSDAQTGIFAAIFGIFYLAFMNANWVAWIVYSAFVEIFKAGVEEKIRISFHVINILEIITSFCVRQHNRRQDHRKN